MNFTQQTQQTQHIQQTQPNYAQAPMQQQYVQAPIEHTVAGMVVPVTAPAVVEATTNTLAVSAHQASLLTYVVYNEYTNGRLSCTPPEKKTVPGTGPNAKPPNAEQNYYNIPLMYNFARDNNSKTLGDFQFEGCEMTTTQGLRTTANVQTGRSEHSIMVRYDINTPEQARFLEVIDEIHNGSAQIVQAYKMPVKMPHFNAQMAQATGFKHPVHRPLDELTGVPTEGRQPSMFLKLFQRGKAPFVEQTIFTGLDGKPIPWTLLQNVEMKFIPLLHFKRIYVGGGKVSMQIEMLSAVVTSIKSRGTTTNQQATISRLQEARPELADTVSAQLAKITSDRQELLLAGSVGANTNQDHGEQHGQQQPSFSGIVANRPNNGPTTGQLPPPGTLPMLPNIGNIPMIGAPNPSMTDFTSAAPTRPTLTIN